MINYLKYNGICKSTKSIKENYVYFCFVGEHVDGHDFIDQAFALGAGLVVGTKEYQRENYIIVKDIDVEFSKAAQTIYEYENIQMNFIGVTGTDGKTSVATLTNLILNKLSTSAYLGTSGLEICGESFGYNGMTTPFADDLFKYINVANKRADNFIMEISSHALIQKRIHGLEFDVIGFTNLSHDHLDFHKTMEEYFKAKQMAFNYLRSDGCAVVNIDDDYGQRLVKETTHKTYTYGVHPEADFKISNILLSINGTSFTIEFQSETYEIQSSLLATFNVYNLVHSIINVYILGHSLDVILSVVSDLTVSGRVQLLSFEQCPNFVLDFAHTPDSILKVLTFLNDLKQGKLIVIGGSAGGRDAKKRSDMGIAMDKFADLLIFTEDDPRDEQVLDIISDLASQITGDYEVVENREDAIAFALANADKNDIIVLLGKAGQTKMYYDGYTSEYIEENVVYTKVKEHCERH